MQKFSSFGRKKKQTKIRHRMVMLKGLQLSGYIFLKTGKYLEQSWIDSNQRDSKAIDISPLSHVLWRIRQLMRTFPLCRGVFICTGNPGFFFGVRPVVFICFTISFNLISLPTVAANELLIIVFRFQKANIFRGAKTFPVWQRRFKVVPFARTFYDPSSFF